MFYLLKKPKIKGLEYDLNSTEIGVTSTTLIQDWYVYKSPDLSMLNYIFTLCISDPLCSEQSGHHKPTSYALIGRLTVASVPGTRCFTGLTLEIWSV